jgi:hypothetical protein
MRLLVVKFIDRELRFALKTVLMVVPLMLVLSMVAPPSSAKPVLVLRLMSAAKPVVIFLLWNLTEVDLTCGGIALGGGVAHPVRCLGARAHT